jgi:DNA-binding NarL/FixJ family response regulator
MPVVHRVLVADDVEDLRRLVTLSLQRSGRFRVVAEAADGAEAVALAQRHQPDLCLLDMAMPVMDGLEALPRIRDVAPDCVVVVLSGFDAERMASTAMGRGAAGYIAKGLRPDDLVGELLSYLGQESEPTREEERTSSLRLGAALHSARDARGFVERTLVSWDMVELADTALLLVSEAVTNAVVHARSASELTLSLGHERLRVEVSDWGGGHLQVREAAADDVNGRGLALIEAMSEVWGTAHTDVGKVVWFELVRPS